MVLFSPRIDESDINKEYIERIVRAVPNPKLNLHYGVTWNLLACEIWYGMYINGDVRNLKPNLQNFM